MQYEEYSRNENVFKEFSRIHLNSSMIVLYLSHIVKL